MRYASIIVCALVGATACGASSRQAGPDAAQEGLVLTLGTTSYILANQVMVRDGNGNLPQSAAIPHLTVAFAADNTDLCATVRTQSAPKNWRLTTFDVFDPSTTTLGVGTFPTPDGGVLLTSNDDTDCVDNGSYTKWADGNVVIEDIGSATTPARGTVDLTLRDNGGSLRGPFVATPCIVTSTPVGTTACY